MKKIHRLFPFLILTLLAVSCIRIDDDDFFEGGNPYYNDGQVSFDGLTLPLTYADFYKRSNVQGGEVWVLELSEEFINYGSTHSDAYLYLELFRPNGAPLDGMYDMLHPAKYLDYATYYEDVVLHNGIPHSYGFHIVDHAFVDGWVRVQFYAGNVHFFEVRLRTYDGKILTAYFEGRLQY